MPAPEGARILLDGRGAARGGRSLRFAGLLEEVRADRMDEVRGALARVAAAAEAGAHAVGYVGYEAAPAFDPALATRPPPGGLPLLWFGLFSERVEEVVGTESAGGAEEGGWTLGEWLPSLDEAGFGERVERVRDWIAAGDTYQANLTFRLRAAFRGDDLALYRHLCRAQRADFCAYLRVGRFSILSASPELFFRWTGDELEMRPMKGTRPRGRWPAEDRELAAELLASPKERAENLMIVDLLRNDAGRVARFGTVEVPRLFEVERYPTVWQLTSTVRARTRPGTDLVEIFDALFPCGSITGAPKVRTTEILAELEESPRGVYTGAIGYVSPGEAVFSVAIRSLVVDRDGGRAELGVGSGITIDSDPAAEYAECLAKAAFVRAEPREFDLLETIRWESGAGFRLLEEHLARLMASAEHFGFPADGAELRRALADAVTGREGVWRLRLLLGSDGAVRTEPHPLPPNGAAPLRVRVAGEPVSSRDPLLFHKTTLREPYERRLAAAPGCDEVILRNERGEVTEATTANLVVVLDGERWTPPLDCGLLPGIERGELLRRGEVMERVLRPEDLRRAEGIYLVNSVRAERLARLVG